MKAYKNFTDAIALIAVFVAFIYIFLAFKSFEPYEKETGEMAKFYEEESVKPYLKLFFTFLATAVCGMAIRKMPAIGLAVSLFPTWFSVQFYYLRSVKKPMLFIVAAFVALAGNIIATVEFFRKESIK
ncbi:MAG: hypothetical protein MR471_04915 [Clostridia bacterium]|nr:hypothetical protein [Clostridia bacterium]MDY3784288.1 hypothetical protein [Eubacteriales bacterium]